MNIKSRISMVLTVCALGGLSAVSAQPSQKTVTIHSQKSRRLNVTETTPGKEHFPAIMVDRVDAVSLVSVNRTSPTLEIDVLRRSSKDQKQGKTAVLLQANHPPTLKIVKMPKKYSTGDRLKVHAEVVDPDGDAVFLSWSCSQGEMLFPITQNGYNIWGSPLVPTGSDKAVEIYISATDTLGGVTEVKASIEFEARTAVPQPILSHFTRFGPDLLDGATSVSDVHMLGNMSIALLDGKNVARYFNLGSRQIAPASASRFSQIATSGNLDSLYGIGKRPEVLSLMRKGSEDVLGMPLSTISMRASKGGPRIDFTPTGKLSLFESLNGVIDIYTINETTAVPVTTHYLRFVPGEVKSVQWISDGFALIQNDSGRYFAADLRANSQFELNIETGNGKMPERCAVGPSGRVACTTESGRNLHIGNLFTGEPLKTEAWQPPGIDQTIGDVSWLGSTLLLGLEGRGGVALYNPSNQSSVILLDATKRVPSHLAHLPDGGAILFDQDAKQLLYLDRWGNLLGVLNAPTVTEFDRMYSAGSDRTFFMNSKSSTVQLLTVQRDATPDLKQWSFKEEKPVAMVPIRDKIMLVLADTRNIRFAGNRMIISIRDLAQLEQKTTHLISAWESSKSYRPKDLHVASDGDTFVIANNKLKSLLFGKVSATGEAIRQQYIDYSAFAATSVRDVNLSSGYIFALCSTPTMKVKLVSAETKRLVGEFDPQVSKKGVHQLSIGPGFSIAVLDERTGQVNFFRPGNGR